MELKIPNDFLLEEERCGYLISAEMKKVWAEEIKLYNIFADICEKHNIKHFFAYGNMLGAARHQGFIPWDDDIDVFVPREDYERFCKVAQSELKYPYSLQNDHTEWGSHIAFSKIRNCETTAILDFEAPYHYRFNQGIFLDVFPLDNVPDDKKELEKMTKKIVKLKKMTGKWSRMFESKKLYFNRSFMYLSAVVFFLPRLIVRAFKIPNIPCRMLEKEMQKYNKTETKCVAMMGLGELKPYPKKYFEETVLLPFEFFEAPVPRDYVALLDLEYGDWHKFVRGAAGGCMHLGMHYDTERSYKEFL